MTEVERAACVLMRMAGLDADGQGNRYRVMLWLNNPNNRQAAERLVAEQERQRGAANRARFFQGER